MTEPCTEQPWYDEIGCDEDKNPDGVHRCSRDYPQLFRLTGGRRVHECACGAMVIEDRAREAS